MKKLKLTTILAFAITTAILLAQMRFHPYGLVHAYGFSSGA
jgi:hypothetical protein